MAFTGLRFWAHDRTLELFPKIVLDVATSIHFYEAVLARDDFDLALLPHPREFRPRSLPAGYCLSDQVPVVIRRGYFQGR
jgi:hypothetical protein